MYFPLDKFARSAQASRMDNAEELVEELFDLPIRKGRDGMELHVEYVRDLTRADLEALKLNRGSLAPPSLKNIRYSHHALARILATGIKENQAALVTGYSVGRVRDLIKDPTFQKLIQDYQTDAKDILTDMTERMMNVSFDALEELHERLRDAPEDFTIPALLEVVKTFADRTGHGPGAKLEHSFNDSTIDRPPTETYEQWRDRKKKETGEGAVIISLEPPTRASD